MGITIMKTLLIIFCIFLTPFIADARMNVVVCGGGVEAASACNPASNEVGNRTEESGTDSMASNEIDCVLQVADCTGTANEGWLRMAAGAETDNCKIGICDAADGSTEHSPAEHDGNCKWSSGTEMVNKNDWTALTGNVAKAVTNGSYYWVCVIGGTGGCKVRYGGVGKKVYYKTTSGVYASPPDNLAGTWSFQADSNMSAYVEID